MLARRGRGSPRAGSQGSLQGEEAAPSTGSLFISLGAPWGRDPVPHAGRTPRGTHLLWCHAGTLPIVQVILQVPVPDPKLQLLQEGFVFHEIQCIEDVESFLQRQDKAISPACLHAGQHSSSVCAACPLSGPALHPQKDGVRVLGMSVALCAKLYLYISPYICRYQIYCIYL